MISELKYKICLYKRYFETGLSITNYAKYLIVFFAIADQNLFTIMILGITYGILSFFLGWAWFRFGFMVAETEVTNRYNLFVNEMRKKFK